MKSFIWDLLCFSVLFTHFLCSFSRQSCVRCCVRTEECAYRRINVSARPTSLGSSATSPSPPPPPPMTSRNQRRVLWIQPISRWRLSTYCLCRRLSRSTPMVRGSVFFSKYFSRRIRFFLGLFNTHWFMEGHVVTQWGPDVQSCQFEINIFKCYLNDNF